LRRNKPTDSVITARGRLTHVFAAPGIVGRGWAVVANHDTKAPFARFSRMRMTCGRWRAHTGTQTKDME